jgi:hypothetical protein
MTERFAPPEVTIRRYPDSRICDVVVVVRGQEMVLRCPSYSQAVKWATWNVSPTIFPNRLSTFRTTRNPATCHLFCVLSAKLEEECGSEAEGKMRAARLQELEEMAARLLALARKLPPGQQRHDVIQEIGRFRAQIAALKGQDLGRPHRGPKTKGK